MGNRNDSPTELFESYKDHTETLLLYCLKINADKCVIR